jgi:hypothetical protein
MISEIFNIFKKSKKGEMSDHIVEWIVFFFILATATAAFYYVMKKYA